MSPELEGPSAAAEESAAEEQGTGAGRRVANVRRSVLIVEDDPAQRAMLVELISLWGYRTVAVGSAEEAEALLEQAGALDIAVVDVFLPGESGVQLITRLRERFPDSVLDRHLRPFDGGHRPAVQGHRRGPVHRQAARAGPPRRGAAESAPELALGLGAVEEDLPHVLPLVHPPVRGGPLGEREHPVDVRPHLALAPEHAAARRASPGHRSPRPRGGRRSRPETRDVP